MGGFSEIKNPDLAEIELITHNLTNHFHNCVIDKLVFLAIFVI